MKRRLRTVLFVAFYAILIAAAALESDQAEEEPEESWKENSSVPHYLEVEIIPSLIAHYVVIGICR